MSSAYKGAILTAAITSMVCMGDTILYSVLPVYADSLGLSDFWVGFLLSINRFIRLAMHGVVATLIIKFGLRKMVLISSVGATVSTFLYSLPSFIFLFASARAIWGIAYSGLRQANLFFAAKDDKTRNKSFVLSNVVKSIGPLSILLIGPFIFNQLDYENGFLLITIIGLLGIVFVYFLPEIEIQAEQYAIQNVLSISWFKILLLFVSFITNGLIVVILFLLFASSYPSTKSLLIAVSFYLFAKRFISFLLPISFLKSYTLISITNHFYIGIALVIFGLLFLSQGVYPSGLLVLFIGDTIIENVAPLEGLKKSGLQKMEVVTSVTLWWDVGKAVGSLLGIILFRNLGGDNLFLFLSIILFILALKNYQDDKMNLKKAKVN